MSQATSAPLDDDRAEIVVLKDVNGEQELIVTTPVHDA